MNARPAYPYLFNFANSPVGGGYKRLYEYARWFNANGGASFVVPSRCQALQDEFPNNRTFLNHQPRYRLQRLLDDRSYLREVGAAVGVPDLYYSYGIPPVRFGRLNWFHLSNVLPLAPHGIPASVADQVKLRCLGFLIRRALPAADVISAESRFSLGLFDAAQAGKLCLSVNGSDDEIENLRNPHTGPVEEIAMVVGTYRHKALADAWKVFDMLRQRSPGLKLVIAGDPAAIPSPMRADQGVIVAGMLTRSEVFARLRAARYYISTTLIENSYNAASEGMFGAEESFVSDIGPHRELLAGTPTDVLTPPGMTRPVFHVRRRDLSGAAIKTWAEVIKEMIDHVR